MAWVSQNTDEGKLSEYNSAALKMKRLDKILDLINQIRTNLLAFNPDFGRYNYDIIYECYCSLYQEVRPQCSEEEKTEGDKLKDAIKSMLEKYPIHEEKRQSVYPYKINVNVNQKHWVVLRKWLDQFENLARKYQDAHGMDTAYESESAMF